MKNLSDLSKEELAAEWRKYYKCEPPKNARREFIANHIKWQRNAKKNGGLSTKAKNEINRLMDELRSGKELLPPNNLNIKSGTKLLREYKGVKHEVIIQDDEFIYQGASYKSLSKIARLITGTQWNGKLFFGVKS